MSAQTTTTASTRTLAAEELAAIARPLGFQLVEAVADPASARERARELAGEDGAVLVTGSLYLLLDLAAVRPAHVP